MILATVMVGVFHQVAGGVMAEIGQQGALIASSVVAQGIGPGNARRLVVVVGVESLLVLGLVVVAVVTALEETAMVIATRMIGTMAVAMVTEIVWTAEIGMVAVTAMPVIGTHLVEIAFLVIAMGLLLIGTLRVGMARTGVMIGKQPRGEVVLTGMEVVVGLHAMMGEATGKGPGLTTALAGEDAHLHMTIAIEGSSLVKTA